MSRLLNERTIFLLISIQSTDWIRDVDDDGESVLGRDAKIFEPNRSKFKVK